MASLPVIEYFRSTISAAWPHTPIFWPNEQPFEPDSSAAYLAVEFPIASETIASIGAPGSNYVPEEGAVVIDLATPLGAGLNPAGAPWTRRLDALRAALRGKNSGALDAPEVSSTILTVNGLRTFTASNLGDYATGEINYYTIQFGWQNGPYGSADENAGLFAQIVSNSNVAGTQTIVIDRDMPSALSVADDFLMLVFGLAGAIVTFDASPAVPMPTANVGMFTRSFAVAYRFCNFG